MRNLREYHRPGSAQEAAGLKREYGRRAAYIAGGSDLMVHRPAEIEAVIDLRHAGLDYVRREGGEHVIGGAARLRQAEEMAGAVASGMLADALRETAPWLIRNAATVAGNIANASPAADSVPALLALDATLLLLDSNEQSVPLADVLAGPHQTSLGDRLIREIRISDEAARRSGAFIKLAPSRSGIAVVNVAVALRRDGDAVRDVRIVLGAVGPTALRARGAESLLEGSIPTDSLLRQVEKAVQEEVRPISDWRATDAYRRRQSGVIARRALQRALGGEK